MVNYSSLSRNEVKLFRVIASCKTLSQCTTAWGYIEAFENWHDIFHREARNTLSTREFMIFEAT